MRYIVMIIATGIFLSSCKNNNLAPDVSKIPVVLSTERYEKDFFSLDSATLQEGLKKLTAKYPSFQNNFIYTILNVDPRWPADSALNYLKGFIGAYRPVFDSSQKVFADFTPYEKEIKKALQYLKYYFPDYKAPKKIITYIGPLDGFGDILDEEHFIVGLHQHLGKNFSLYGTEWVSQTYPAYITERFTPEYISVNAMKNIISDLYPEKPEDKSLLLQMVEKGKRLYLLQKLLPETQEYKLIGYTVKQLKESYSHEAAIWNLFTQNNFLQIIDNNLIKNYIGESPKTQELGESAPGNIGSFAGWQIVKKYMDKFPDTNLKALMVMDAEKLFNEAKYKP